MVSAGILQVICLLSISKNLSTVNIIFGSLTYLVSYLNNWSCCIQLIIKPSKKDREDYGNAK